MRQQRRIPFWIVIRLFFSHSLAIFGIAFTLMGVFFAYMQSGDDVFKIKHIDNNAPKTVCIITNIMATNIEVNEETVYEYYYEFTAGSGEKIENSEKHFYGVANIGDRFTVQYNPDNPKEARILDITDDYSSFWDYFVFIFPLIGIILIVIIIINVTKKVRIMRVGQTVYGTYAGKEPTGTRVNDNPVYEVFFKFTCPNDRKEYTISTKTTSTNNLEDDEKELIIFDAENPEKAFPVDILPKFAKRFIEENYKK